MRNHLAVCFVTFLCLLSCRASAEETHKNGNASVRMPELFRGILSEAEHKRMGEFLTMVGYPRVDFIEERERSAPNVRAFSLHGPSGPNYASLTCDTEDGRIVRYVRENPRLGIQGTDQEVKVRKEEEAFRLAQPVLSYYELPGNMRAYSITKTLESSPPFNVQEWYIDKDFSFEGVPCRRCGFRCVVCSYTGTILSVSYRKMIPPMETEAVLTREQARDAAVHYIQRSPFVIFVAKEYEVLPSSEALKVIVVPDVKVNPRDEGESPPEPIRAHYCWEVPVEAIGKKDEELRGVIWVRMDTGEVLPGFW
jgi:hypothetical protein